MLLCLEESGRRLWVSRRPSGKNIRHGRFRCSSIQDDPCPYFPSNSGDAAQTRIEAGGDTARNVAESIRYCYFQLPRKVGPGRNKIVLHEGTHVVTFDVFVPRLDLMQVLEDEGATAAEASPPAAAAKSDRPSSPFPFGLGFGIGGGGDNGGEEPWIGLEHRSLH